MGSEAPQNPGVNTTVVSVKWSTFYQIGCCLCIFPTNLQATFFGGLSPEVRGEAWKFLLQYFPFSSTTRQREVLRKAKEEEYMKIDHMRWSEFKIILTWNSNSWTASHIFSSWWPFLATGRADILETYLDDILFHLYSGSASDLENNVCSHTAENSVTSLTQTNLISVCFLQYLLFNMLL